MKTTLLLIAISAMALSLKVCAMSDKLPKGRFVGYEYHRGGGMNPYDMTVFHLRYDDSGKRLLTVSGECQGELITIEVGQEVFDSCLAMVKKYNLSRSKGFYESKYELLDAPSSSFNVSFDDPAEWISGSGDMPDFLWKGINAINTYLRSVVGDRKAEGHVDRIYGADHIGGLHWTDGTVDVVTPEDNADPLKTAFRQMTEGTDDTRLMGYEHYHDGDQHYLLIFDDKNDLCRLYYSFEGGEKAKKQLTDKQLADLRRKREAGDSVAWPVVNERFLCHPMIDALSNDQLKQMFGSIHELPRGDYGNMVPHTDIGEVNYQLLLSEMKKRGMKEEN